MNQLSVKRCKVGGFLLRCKTESIVAARTETSISREREKKRSPIIKLVGQFDQRVAA